MLTPTRGTDKHSRDGHRGSEEPLHAGQARWSPSLNRKPAQEAQPASAKEPEPLAEPPSQWGEHSGHSSSWAASSWDQ
eukprot:11066984-Heterocapsa_arctica.AAC.1